MRMSTSRGSDDFFPASASGLQSSAEYSQNDLVGLAQGSGAGFGCLGKYESTATTDGRAGSVILRMNGVGSDPNHSDYLFSFDEGVS